jgi:hypothetical protein
MKMRSLNNTRQVQSDYLKRVERLCGEEMAEEMNINILWWKIYNTNLPPHVLRDHYRSLASKINKPVKYINKATL